MPLKEYKNMWVLRKKKFFLIVLCAHTLIIVLLFGIFAHLNLYIKSKKYNDFASDFAEFLKRSVKATMEIKRLWCLALEIIKTVNNLNPYYLKEIFSETTNLIDRPLDINFISIVNEVIRGNFKLFNFFSRENFTHTQKAWKA